MRAIERKPTPDACRALRLSRALIAGLALVCAPAGAASFTTDFSLEDCAWSAKGTQNPYFSLRPGYQLVLEGEDEGADVRAEVTVLRQFETIEFTTPDGTTLRVRTRVLEEREFEDGEIVEVSRNWVARCVQTSDIFYFGEEVDIYEDGEIVSSEGAWRAGVDGAQPGLLMPGRFLLGARYFQEQAPDVALDRGKNVDMGLAVTVPAGSFADCVVVQESSPLNPDSSGDIKVYCPGVGIVMDEALALVEIAVVPAG
jgi:hypothetical protein